MHSDTEKQLRLEAYECLSWWSISYVVDAGKDIPFFYPKPFNRDEKTFVKAGIIHSIFVLRKSSLIIFCLWNLSLWLKIIKILTISHW